MCGGYPCSCVSLAAWSLRRGGWDIYLSFQGSPHATCDGERCGSNVRRQSAYEASVGARLVASHHQRSSWQWHCSNRRLYRKPKKGAAKSSINKACDGCTSELLQFFLYSPITLRGEMAEQYVRGTQCIHPSRIWPRSHVWTQWMKLQHNDKTCVKIKYLTIQHNDL